MNLIASIDNKAKKHLPIVLWTAGENDFQELINRPDGAPYHHIFYTVRGKGRIETSDGVFDMEAGEALFMRKNAATKYYAVGEEFATAWITFDGFAVNDILDYYGAENFAFIKSRSIYNMMMDILRQVENNAASPVLSQMVFELINVFFERLKKQTSFPSLEKAKRFIEDNYKNDIAVLDVAKFVGVSESFVYRIFKEHDGKTPNEYLRQVRVHEAQKLLLSEKKMQISDVSTACGFTDVAYFCKVFKSETGSSPKKYQKNYIM